MVYYYVPLGHILVKSLWGWCWWLGGYGACANGVMVGVRVDVMVVIGPLIFL